jgi:hypothetical protein
MDNHIFKNLFILICFFAISACQKTEIEEQPSGIITVEVEGIKYNFEITRYLGLQLSRGRGVFEGVNDISKESFWLGLFDEGSSDFFDATFKPEVNNPNRPQFIFIQKDGFTADAETTKITITRADFESKTIEGTFSFEALGELSKRRIKVENGYFKIKMPAWLYQ